MKLFHFTARHHWEGTAGHGGSGIKYSGLIPNPHPLISLPPLVWLTLDGSWSQDWSPRVVPGIGCDRTEVRLSVVIPKASRTSLLTVAQVLPFVRRDWQEDFVGDVDVSPWRAYVGHIPSSWIRLFAERPTDAAVNVA